MAELFSVESVGFCLVLDLTEASRIHKENTCNTHMNDMYIDSDINICLYTKKALLNIINKIVSFSYMQRPNFGIFRMLRIHYDITTKKLVYFYCVRFVLVRFESFGLKEMERKYAQQHQKKKKNNNKTDTTHKNKYRMNSFVKSSLYMLARTHISLFHRIYADIRITLNTLKQTNIQTDIRRERIILFQAHTTDCHTSIYGKHEEKQEPKLS